MKIATLSRTISGLHFDNLSITANLEDGDNPMEKAKELDAILRKMMGEINAQQDEHIRRERDRNETIDLLERAIAFAKNEEIPF